MRCGSAILVIGALFASIMIAPVAAGNYEDGSAAYRKGDFATALRLYRLAAVEGNIPAHAQLGFMYSKGEGAKQSDIEAANWWRPAALAGDASSQTALGLAYATGKGVPQDFVEAVKWSRLGAQRNNVFAQFAMGDFYSTGRGVLRDYAEAAEWFRRAALQGYADAQYRLGDLYYRGWGVSQNYILAHAWLGLAAEQGHHEATEKKNTLASSLSRAQIEEAAKLAAEWRPAPVVSRAQTPPVHPTSKPKPQGPEGIQISSGTAFFVSDKGEALTNEHVIRNCGHIRVRETTARVVARDAKNDLALIATDLHPTRWARWRSSVTQGEDIVVYGFPLVGMLASTGNVTTGIVTALAGSRDDSTHLQISAPVQSGNSGGPILDRSGNVAGVVVMKLMGISARGETWQNVAFAINGAVAMAFLKAQRVAIDADVSAPAALTTSEIATQGSELTALVKCMR